MLLQLQDVLKLIYVAVRAVVQETARRSVCVKPWSTNVGSLLVP